MYLCSFRNLRLSRLPCVVSELTLAEHRLGGCLCVYTPVPPPLQGSRCMPALYLFLECTRVSVDVRCVVCEFPANVECVQLAALAPQLGPARHVGRGPWLRAQSRQPWGGGYFLVAIGEGLVAAPWKPSAGAGYPSWARVLDVSARWRAPA